MTEYAARRLAGMRRRLEGAGPEPVATFGGSPLADLSREDLEVIVRYQGLRDSERLEVAWKPA